MIKLNLVELDYMEGDDQATATYDIEGLTTEDLLTIGDIGYSSTFKNSKIKLTLEETDSLQLFAVCDLEDDNYDPLPEGDILTEIYLDIFETSDLIYIGEVKGNRVEDTGILIRTFEQWLKTKKAVELSEGLTEDMASEEDGAWSEEEVRAELIRMTNNFKKNEGEITTWYEEEKEHIKNILEAASYQVEISDGRKNKDEDMNWVITFVKKVNESLTENSNLKLALELIDNDEDNMVAAYKVSSGKDALSLAVETIGYESGFKVRKEDIKKLEVVSSLSEGNDNAEVFIDIDENKDLIYCGKFNSGDYTNIDKIIKVIEDWSKGVAIEESLTESLYLLSLSDNSRNWSVAVEADSEETAKDTFYANVGNDTSIKINSVNEVEEKNLSKDIKIVRKHPIEESLNFDVDRVQKRIARVSEFNNGSVIFNDYEVMTSDEAEEKAKQMSIENPDEIFYIKYDDIMNPSSDIKWKNGEQVDHLGNKLNGSAIDESIDATNYSSIPEVENLIKILSLDKSSWNRAGKWRIIWGNSGKNFELCWDNSYDVIQGFLGKYLVVTHAAKTRKISFINELISLIVDTYPEYSLKEDFRSISTLANFVVDECFYTEGLESTEIEKYKKDINEKYYGNEPHFAYNLLNEWELDDIAKLGELNLRESINTSISYYSADYDFSKQGISTAYGYRKDMNKIDYFVKEKDLFHSTLEKILKVIQQQQNLSTNSKVKESLIEGIDFDYNKKLSIREMYDFLLKMGKEEGCDIILDWEDDGDLNTPKTVVEWLDLIIETYYDLEGDLRQEGDTEQIERNHMEVIDPLEDLRDEMNNEALVKIDEIYYEVLSYNDDSGDDDFNDYLTFGKAEKAFEEWVRDFKTNGVNGAVELLQVDDTKRTSKQLRYWSSEDDKLYSYDESLNKNCCDYQTAYEKLDKFMSDSEEDMNNFYEAKTKEDLLSVLENAVIDEDMFISYAGDGATLEGFAEYILANKLNESIQEETVKDYGCDKCGKRVPEDKIHWFYGAEVGLCNDCHDTMTDEERYQLDGGDFSSLKEANKTKAQRHNDMMNKVFDNAKKQNQILKDILKDNGVSEEEIGELEKATGLHGSALHKKVYDLGLNNEFAKRLGLKEDLAEDHLTLDGDTLDTIKDFINDAFEYMREDEVELSDEVILYATPTRDRENNQEVTFDVIENDVILDSVVGYPGNTEYCYETITSILREQTGLVKMSEGKEEGEDKAMAYSEILNAKIKVNPNKHPADEKMFSGTYFIGTYEEGDLAGQEYVFVLADSEGHRFMNEYLGYPKDKNGYVDQPTDVITLNGQDNVYFMVEPEELFKEKVEESIVMNEKASDPDFDAIEQALMGIKGTAKVEFDYRPNDGVYKKPEDHFIVLIDEDTSALEDTDSGDALIYFRNRKQWKLDIINKLKELGWKLEDPIEDNSSYLYLVMEKIKPEVKTEGYETLDGNKVEVYSDYETAKSRALMLGLKEAEYGDEFGSDISYCAWNKSGDRNEEVEVLAYYKFENGKPVALTDEEKATVESVKDLTFDDITGPINLN